MTRQFQNMRSRRNEPNLQLISSRTIPYIDSETFASRRAREALFRSDGDRFVLYLSDGKSSIAEERVIFLDLREALIWLNEPSEQHGSFWT